MLGRNPYWFGVDKAEQAAAVSERARLSHRARSGRRRFEVPVRRARRGSITSSPKTTAGTQTTRKRAITRSQPRPREQQPVLLVQPEQGPAAAARREAAAREESAATALPIRSSTPGSAIRCSGVPCRWRSIATRSSAACSSAKARRTGRLPVPSNKEWYSPDLLHDDYNLAESKRLLASIGFKDGNGDGVLEDTRGNPVTFQLKTNADNTMRVATANFIKDDLAKVGIRVMLSPVDFNSLITNFAQRFAVRRRSCWARRAACRPIQRTGRTSCGRRAFRITSSSGSRSPRRRKRRESISWSTRSSPRSISASAKAIWKEIADHLERAGLDRLAADSQRRRLR